MNRITGIRGDLDDAHRKMAEQLDELKAELVDAVESNDQEKLRAVERKVSESQKSAYTLSMKIISDDLSEIETDALLALGAYLSVERPTREIIRRLVDDDKAIGALEVMRRCCLATLATEVMVRSERQQARVEGE